MSDAQKSGTGSGPESQSTPGEPPSAVTTISGGAVPAAELRRRATAWALWDVGNSAFQAVIVTFVFTPYLSSDLFLDPAIAATGQDNPQDPAYLAAQAASTGTIASLVAVAGVAIAVLAPALGIRADGTGRRKRWLTIYSCATILTMLAMFAITPDEPMLLWGAILLGIGTIFSELAGVNANAMLSQVSTPATVGRISGLGWGLGYLGSILLLALALALFIEPFGGEGTGGLLRVPSGEEGQALNIRLTIITAALWFLIFLIPVLIRVPEIPADPQRERIGFFRSYAELGRSIARLARTRPRVLLFLAASAVFRDGLSGIFTFGAVLAVQVYGFSSGEVILFAVAANLVAGAGTLLAGWLDDRIGPKAVMTGSLIALIICCGALLALGNEPGAFWAAGLLLCFFVGPAQAASRSYLARVTPPGHEGELFGLYATTNRVASFLAPWLFGLLVAATGQTKLGIIGLAIVLTLGLLLLLPVRAREASELQLRPASADEAFSAPAGGKP